MNTNTHFLFSHLTTMHHSAFSLQSSSLTLPPPSLCTICVCSPLLPFSQITQSFAVMADREHPYDQRDNDKHTKTSLPTSSGQCLTSDAELRWRRSVVLLRSTRVPDLRPSELVFCRPASTAAGGEERSAIQSKTSRSSTMAFSMRPACVDHGASSFASRRLAIPCWPDRPARPCMQLLDAKAFPARFVRPMPD